LLLGIVCLTVLTVITGYNWIQADRERNRANQARAAADQARADEHLQSELTLIGLMQQQILTIENDILSAQTFSSQLQTSAAKTRITRGSGPEARKTATRVAAVRGQANELEEYRDSLLLKKDLIARARADTIARIDEENRRLWGQKSDAERERILADVSQMIIGGKFRSDNQSEPSTGGKLRMALFAIAAIPENDRGWNDALRKLIADYRGRKTNAPLVGQIWGLAFNPQNANQAAFGDDVGIVRLWDPFSNEFGTAEKELSSAASGIVNSIAFSPDGRLLAAAYRSAGTVIWNVESGNVLCAFNPNTALDRAPSGGSGGLPNVGSYSVAFSPDGRILAVAGTDRAAHLWDVRGCTELIQGFRHSDEVFGVAFHPEGRLLATASGDTTVSVWLLDQPDRPLRTFEIGKAMFAVAFSPAGRTLVAAGADGTARILNLATQEQIAFMPPQKGTLGQVAFSPDGKYVVATASEDGEAFVSDPDTGKLVYRLGGNQWGTPTQKRLFGVAFSPDSKYLLTGNLDGVARLWAVGDDEDRAIAGAGRDELIRIGGERIGANAMVLPAAECWTLRSKEIPIFVFADRPWEERLKAESCPLPFLKPPERRK
jgi:hypothetical protein